MVARRPTWGFGAVDRTGDPHFFVGYLDQANALDWTKAYKRRATARLGLAPGQHALDVGCGTGEDVRAMAEIVGLGGRAVGLDASEAMIAEARRRTAGGAAAEFRVGDAHDLPFPDASFDGCRIDRVLQHLDDPAGALAELARVARAGAAVVASEPDRDTAVVDAPDLEATRVVAGVHADRIRHGRVGRQLPALFRAAGLRVANVEPDTVVLTRWAETDAIFGLRADAEEAVRRGLLPPGRAAAWLASLERADAAGDFFAAVTLFIVAGRKG
jgi:SAM-dependent methyltransferase